MQTFQLVKRSSNKKVGPIPVTNSPRATCPASCPFKGEGCYAEAGFHTRLNWDKLDAGERGVPWSDFVLQISKLGDGQLWRHNVAGDLPGDGDTIDATAMYLLLDANRGKRGFTYTHYPLSDDNVALIRYANKTGFTINVSTNNIREAVDVARTFDVPTTTVLPSDSGDWRRVDTDGVRVVRCPAEYRDDVSCATCKLCSVSNRDVVVGFTAHGTKKKTVDVIASAA